MLIIFMQLSYYRYAPWHQRTFKKILDLTKISMISKFMVQN